MSKRKSVPRTPVKKKEEKPREILFSKPHSRLLRTIASKHNQAMQSEMNTALLEIYTEMEIDVDDVVDDYLLKENFSGIELRKPPSPPAPPITGDEEEGESTPDKEAKSDGES